MKELSEPSYLALSQYLLAHEYEIAKGRKDYGSLMTVFIEIFDREPEE